MIDSESDLLHSYKYKVETFIADYYPVFICELVLLLNKPDTLMLFIDNSSFDFHISHPLVVQDQLTIISV